MRIKVRNIKNHYDFNLDKNIKHLNEVETEQQIFEIIYNIFIIPADKDYISARLLVKNLLTRGFYWSAAQAVEKYLKAFVVLHGGVVKSTSHSISDLFELALKIDDGLSKIDLSECRSFGGDIVVPHLDKLDIFSFIDYIDCYGCSDNRYNSFPIEFDSSILFALDKFVYEIRGLMYVNEITDSLRIKSPQLIEALSYNNLYFGEADCIIVNDEYPALYVFESAVLDRAISSFLNEVDDEYIQKVNHQAILWLHERVKLPKQKEINKKLKAAK